MPKTSKNAPPDKCPKVWEKARRDKMKGLFEELSRLLPNFDPTMQSSRAEVIQKAMSHIRDLQAQNEELLKGGFNKVYKNKIETWKRRVKELVGRVDQLASILRTANIHVPPLALHSAPAWTEKRPKFWTQKLVLPPEKIESFMEDISQRKKRKSDTQDNEKLKKPNKKKRKITSAATGNTKKIQIEPTLPGKIVKQAIVRPMTREVKVSSVGVTNLNSNTATVVTVSNNLVQPIVTVSNNLAPPIPFISYVQPNNPFSNTLPNPVVPITIQSIISPHQPSLGRTTNTYILTNGNLLPVPRANVLSPVIINAPSPMILVQQPISVPQPCLPKPPANKKKISKATTTMTFTNKTPIPTPRKGGKGSSTKIMSNAASTVAATPAVSPTAAFLNSFPVVTSSKSAVIGDSGSRSETIEFPKTSTESATSDEVGTNAEDDAEKSMGERKTGSKVTDSKGAHTVGESEAGSTLDSTNRLTQPEKPLVSPETSAVDHRLSNCFKPINAVAVSTDAVILQDKSGCNQLLTVTSVIESKDTCPVSICHVEPEPFTKFSKRTAISSSQATALKKASASSLTNSFTVSHSDESEAPPITASVVHLQTIVSRIDAEAVNFLPGPTLDKANDSAGEQNKTKICNADKPEVNRPCTSKQVTCESRKPTNFNNSLPTVAKDDTEKTCQSKPISTKSPITTKDFDSAQIFPPQAVISLRPTVETAESQKTSTAVTITNTSSYSQSVQPEKVEYRDSVQTCPSPGIMSVRQTVEANTTPAVKITSTSSYSKNVQPHEIQRCDSEQIRPPPGVISLRPTVEASESQMPNLQTSTAPAVTITNTSSYFQSIPPKYDSTQFGPPQTVATVHHTAMASKSQVTDIKTDTAPVTKITSTSSYFQSVESKETKYHALAPFHPPQAVISLRPTAEATESQMSNIKTNTAPADTATSTSGYFQSVQPKGVKQCDSAQIGPSQTMASLHQAVKVAGSQIIDVKTDVTPAVKITSSSSYQHCDSAHTTLHQTVEPTKSRIFNEKIDTAPEAKKFSNYNYFESVQSNETKHYDLAQLALSQTGVSPHQPVKAAESQMINLKTSNASAANITSTSSYFQSFPTSACHQNNYPQNKVSVESLASIPSIQTSCSNFAVLKPTDSSKASLIPFVENSTDTNRSIAKSLDENTKSQKGECPPMIQNEKDSNHISPGKGVNEKTNGSYILPSNRPEAKTDLKEKQAIPQKGKGTVQKSNIAVTTNAKSSSSYSQTDFKVSATYPSSMSHSAATFCPTSVSSYPIPPYTSNTFPTPWAPITTLAPTSVPASNSTWYTNQSTSIGQVNSSCKSNSADSSWLPIPGMGASEMPCIAPKSMANASSSWRPMSTDPLWSTISQPSVDSWAFNVVPKETLAQFPTPTFLEPLQQNNACKLSHSTSNIAATPTQTTAPNFSTANQIGLYPFSNAGEVYSRPMSETSWPSNMDKIPNCSNMTTYSKTNPMTSHVVSNQTSTSCAVTSSKPGSAYAAQQLINDNYNFSHLDRFRSERAIYPPLDPKLSTKTALPAKPMENAYSSVPSLVSASNTNNPNFFVDVSVNNASHTKYQVIPKPPKSGNNNMLLNTNTCANSAQDSKPCSGGGYVGPNLKSQVNLNKPARNEIPYPTKTFPSNSARPMPTEVHTPYLSMNQTTYIPNYSTSSMVLSEAYSTNLPTPVSNPSVKPFVTSGLVTSSREVDHNPSNVNLKRGTDLNSAECESNSYKAVSTGKKQYPTSYPGPKTGTEIPQTTTFSGNMTKTTTSKSQIVGQDAKTPVWNGPFFSNNIHPSDNAPWIDYACIGENRPKPPINWMTEPEPRIDAAPCGQEENIQARLQNPTDRKDIQPAQNVFDFCLNNTGTAEDELSKGKNRKRESECVNQDYFSWLPMKVDPFVVPSTLPTLVGDLALGGEPVPTKKIKTAAPLTENCIYPRSAKEIEPGNPVPQEPFTNLAKNIFDVSQTDANKTCDPPETIVLKNIFELPTPTGGKQRSNQGQNSFLSVSQLVETPTMEGSHKSDYSYYNQRPGKSKRASGWKCSDKKCQQTEKVCNSYTTEALLKTPQPQDDFTLTNPSAYQLDFPTDSLLMDANSMQLGQLKQKTYSNRPRKQDCWNVQSAPSITFSSSEVPVTSRSIPMPNKPPTKTSEEVPLPLPYLADSRIPNPQAPNLHLSAPLPFPRFPGSPLPLSFPQHKPGNDGVPFTGIFPSPRPCGQSENSFPPGGARYPGPRKPFSYPRSTKMAFPPFPPVTSDSSQKVSGKPAPLHHMSNSVLTSPLPLGRSYPPFPTIPAQPSGPSGSSLANFNLTTIFPEMNKKGSYQYP